MFKVIFGIFGVFRRRIVELKITAGIFRRMWINFERLIFLKLRGFLYLKMFLHAMIVFKVIFGIVVWIVFKVIFGIFQ